ncbi:MAG: hypothetical protein QGH40_07215, partial [bacterium]|nr:hypothetical protein [bacterium]
ITFGWGLPEAESYPRILEKRLKELDPNKRYEIINAGVPGYKFNQMAVSFMSKLALLRPSLVVILTGVPDKKAMTRCPFPTTDRYLGDVIKTAKTFDIEVILISPPKSSFEPNPHFEDFRDFLMDMARTFNLGFVDIYTLFKLVGHQRGLKLEIDGSVQRLVSYDKKGKELLLEVTVPAGIDPATSIHSGIYRFLDNTDRSETLFFDAGHPTSEGHRLIGEYLARCVTKM